MVYDEGFEVSFDNVKYFAFNRYFHDDTEYKSDCSNTLVGWYNNEATGERGCYKASKKDGSK